MLKKKPKTNKNKNQHDHTSLDKHMDNMDNLVIKGQGPL